MPNLKTVQRLAFVFLVGAALTARNSRLGATVHAFDGECDSICGEDSGICEGGGVGGYNVGMGGSWDDMCNEALSACDDFCGSWGGTDWDSDDTYCDDGGSCVDIGGGWTQCDLTFYCECNEHVPFCID